MRNVYRKIACVFIFIMIILTTGCVDFAEGYKEFCVSQFEEFFDITSIEEQNEYLASHDYKNLEFDDVLIIPYIKEISDTECGILLYPYSKSTTSNISLDKISLTTSDGTVIADVEEFGEVNVFEEWTDEMQLICTFDKSSDWFFDGNSIVLHVQVSMNKGDSIATKSIDYNVHIKEYRGTSLQV